MTVRKADLQRDIKSLLSYAVGCMFGRYSLDKPGLIFAGGNFDSVYWKYKGQAALDENDSPIEGGYAGISLAEYHYPKFHDTDDWETATWLSYEPDVDNVIPITDEEYLGQLESKREEITQTILEQCRTKRKNLYVAGPVALNVAQRFSVRRLCDKDGKHNLANQFVGKLMEQLVQKGRLVTAETRNGPGIRTATDAEIRSPLPGQQQMTL